MREPDLAGVALAWKIVAKPAIPDQQATLEAWLVNGAFHSLWSYWMVGVIHLRPLPSVRPAHRKYPEAEYEILIVSIQSPPGSENHPDPDDLETLKPLEPPDLIWQFHGATDDQAREVVRLMVRAIVSGRASPDSDYRTWWLSSLPTTLVHVTTGGHHEQ